MNQLPLRHRRALQPKKLQRKHLHPLLLDFHRGLHARETHGRVHLVYRPEQNRRRRSAPNLDCDPCGSSVGCDLLRHTYGMSAPWPTAFGLHAAPCPPGFKVTRRDSCLAFLARPPASQSVLHCYTLHVSLTPSSGKTCCNLEHRPDSSAKLLEQSYEKNLDIVSSARPSGQEDFQRGTPPVSLASCSINPFLRACFITE